MESTQSINCYMVPMEPLKKNLQALRDGVKERFHYMDQED